MATFKNHYETLGVDNFADPEAVKSAFRKLARQHHPDLNGNTRAAEDRFKEINAAYEALNNPDKRAIHDMALRAKLGLSGKTAAQGKGPPARSKTTASGGAPGAPPGGKSSQGTGGAGEGASTGKSPDGKAAGKSSGTGEVPGASRGSASQSQTGSGKGPGAAINEMFETFLKKGFGEGGARGEGASRGSAEEGIFRNAREASSASGAQNAQAQGQASAREGVPMGSSAGSPREKVRRGEDVVVKTAITPMEAQDGVVKTVNVQHNELCKRCSGTGRVSGALCTACNGEKVLVRHKKIDVRIPAGVKNGSRVRVAREGGRGSGGAENGDLFLQIEIAYDPSLRIEGLDVYGDVPISVTDAVLGGEIEVPTLNGPVQMTVPPGTQTGRVFRLKERGVQSGATKGDHYATVVLVTPENLAPRERELYNELARLRPEKPKKGR